MLSTQHRIRYQIWSQEQIDLPTPTTLLTCSHLPFPTSLKVTLTPEPHPESFLANITASNALTRGQFRILQAAIWPMYFKLQMIVSILLALTYPGGHAKEATLFSGAASLAGVVDKDHRLTVLLPLTMMFIFSATNVVFVAPKTISTMWKLHVGMLTRCPLGPNDAGRHYANLKNQSPFVRTKLAEIQHSSRKTTTTRSISVRDPLTHSLAAHTAPEDLHEIFTH